MRTSLLICATCLLVTGSCSAQFRLPSLSSALSSLTGFGGSSSNSNGAQSGQSSSAGSAASSPYSGLVRDYGRNLMMAMSSIYPTLFKPPQSQSQQQQPQQSPQQQQQQAAPSPFDQFGASQQSQSLFGAGGQSGPSFSFGGSTFSISPSFPSFGSLTGASGGGGGVGSGQPQPMASAPSGSHSPFSASFGSSINSPPSFGALSNSPFLSQSMPSFAPASSYSAAFEAANGGPSSAGQPMFGMNSQPSGLNSQGLPSGAIMSQQSQASPINSYPSMSSFGGQHDSSAQILAQPSHHQSQSVAPMGAHPQSGMGMHQQGPYGSPQQVQQASHMGQQQQQPQYASSQQYRPDMMSIAASAPVPSSSQYSNYGSVPAQQGPSQPSSSSIGSSSSGAMGSPSSSSYQQPSYR